MPEQQELEREQLTWNPSCRRWRQDAVRIERIVSNGHASPERFWYDQDEHEWVLLLEGEAEIEFAEGEPVHLTRGDTLNLPAHTRHRVAYTSRPAIWLAVFY